MEMGTTLHVKSHCPAVSEFIAVFSSTSVVGTFAHVVKLLKKGKNQAIFSNACLLSVHLFVEVILL